METLKCSICFFRYDNNQREAVVLPCGHTFCSSCIKLSRNICPTCRKPFNNDQVNKNYIVHSMVEEMNAQPVIKGPERCTTHKREIDRFCKPCLKLMCSVCHCSHVGSTTDVISDMNLREEVENIVRTYKDVGKVKEDFSQKINYHIQRKTEEAERNQIYDQDQIKRFAQVDIESTQKEKEAAIKEAEEDAQRKIREIETSKRLLISQADDFATKKIKEIELRTETLLEELYSKQRQVIAFVENNCEALKRQFTRLQDLSKSRTTTLEECQTIYKRELLQRASLQEFLKIPKNDIDLLLKQRKFEVPVKGAFIAMPIANEEKLAAHFAGKKFKVGDTVNYSIPRKTVVATVKNIVANEILISYKADGQLCQEWISEDSTLIWKYRL